MIAARHLSQRLLKIEPTETGLIGPTCTLNIDKNHFNKPHVRRYRVWTGTPHKARHDLNLFQIEKMKNGVLRISKTFGQRYSVSVPDAEVCRIVIRWDGVSKRSCMLLSTWTEYDGTSLFGGSLRYIERHVERTSHSSVPTLSRDLRPRKEVKSNGPCM